MRKKTQTHEEEIEYQRNYKRTHKDKCSEIKKKCDDAHKEQRAEYQKEYRAKNKEKLALKKKEYEASHKEEIRERKRRYREAHKEEIAEYSAKYIAKNKEKIDRKKKTYAENNPEKVKNTLRESHKKYYCENKDFIRERREVLAIEQGFDSWHQQLRYRDWCKKNGIPTKKDNPQFIENKTNWIENVDSGGYKKKELN